MNFLNNFHTDSFFFINYTLVSIKTYVGKREWLGNMENERSRLGKWGKKHSHGEGLRKTGTEKSFALFPFIIQ